MYAMYYSLIIMCNLLLVAPAISCPTCVGKVKKNGPAFFSDELYQLEKKKEERRKKEKELIHS